MPIRLRMSLHGNRHKKVFHIVAINSKLRRDAKPAELLGIYDPHDWDRQNMRQVRWSVDRIRYWLSVGALPSKPVVKLLELGRILVPGSPYASQATKPKHPVTNITPLRRPKAKVVDEDPSQIQKSIETGLSS